MRTLVVLFAVSLILGSCSSNDEPEELLEEDTYINLMVELQLLQSYQRQYQPDSSKVDSLRSAVFSEYNASESQFNNSHLYYQEHLSEQNKRIKQAIERLRKDRMRADSLSENEARADSL